MDIPYNMFESAEDLMTYYKKNLITENKSIDAGEDTGEDDISSKDSKSEAQSVKKSKYSCIFKHIIVFTNSRKDSNKTLANIKEAIANLDNPPELHVFVAAACDYDEGGRKLTIRDDESEFTIKDQSNIDTLVFSRLGVQGETECEYIVKLLQDRGFLVLNPIRNSALASNKYETAALLQKGGIPQPRFCLMTKTILYNEELYAENLRDIYPEFSDDPDKNKDLQIVVKTLSGHGGTGVFLTNCRSLKAILQAIFSIDPDVQLLLQKKEEADGGDIRVHVLTLRNKQVILGAMKRIKVSGDFRSNVSLGAEVESVELTDAQKEIALSTAALSGLPWCAVDIMPLVKNSNPDFDNVVLEINASPGTDGISEVLGENFINVLLNELDDSNEFRLQNKTAGHEESATITFVDEHNNNISKTYLARLDTGNGGGACTLEVGDYKEDDGYVMFKVDGKQIKFKKEGEMQVTAGDDGHYTRPTFYVPEMRIGMRVLKHVLMACVKTRNNKSTNLLVNRKSLSLLGYVVSSSDTHILTDKIEKVKII